MVIINTIPSSLLHIPPLLRTTSFVIGGVVKSESIPLSGALVRLFLRENGQLDGQAISRIDGSYEFNVADQKERFIISHHPKREFNAVVQDLVVPE